MSTEFGDALRVELDRRIIEISNAPEEAFGHIGGGEWALFCLVALVLPAFLVWLAA